MAGGFLLSDWVPAAGRFFSPGVEAVYWSGIDDLHRKIAFYLEKPEERNRIVQRGRNRVLLQHTYKRRIDEALAWLEKQISSG